MSQLARRILIALIVFGVIVSAKAQTAATTSAFATIVLPHEAVMIEGVELATPSVNEAIVEANKKTPGITGEIGFTKSIRVMLASFRIVNHQYAFDITLEEPALPVQAQDHDKMKARAFTVLNQVKGKKEENEKTVSIGATFSLKASQTSEKYISTTPYFVTVNFN